MEQLYVFCIGYCIRNNDWMRLTLWLPTARMTRKDTYTSSTRIQTFNQLSYCVSSRILIWIIHKTISPLPDPWRPTKPHLWTLTQVNLDSETSLFFQTPIVKQHRTSNDNDTKCMATLGIKEALKEGALPSHHSVVTLVTEHAKNKFQQWPRNKVTLMTQRPIPRVAYSAPRDSSDALTDQTS